MFAYDEVVDYHPVEPPKHVWVLATGRHGAPTAGVVVTWAPAQAQSATASPWLAQVVTTPFKDALCIQWVTSDKLIELTDPTPVTANPVASKDDPA